MPYNMLVILGPTASGKTRLGVGLARRMGGEIISADSRQVFCGMDIGTGKDLAEYGEVPHHLIDVIEAGSEFSVFAFQRRFLEAFADIRQRGRLPVMVGGTGLYLEAVLKGYRMVEVPEDPELHMELAGLSMEQLAKRLRRANPSLHNTTDLLERERLVRAIEIAEYGKSHVPQPLPELRAVVFGIRWERSFLRQRIILRLRERLEQGLIDEVARLHAGGISYETLEYYGLEYRFVARHLKGEMSSNDLFQKLASAIHDFAKRQENWFRRMERTGTVIQWLEGNADPLGKALSVLENHYTQ